MSTVKVNKIDKRTGSTLELGGPGTAVTLACGATQTGFGRTGTVDWCTTAKTSPFTAVSGNGYFINTTSGAVTVTLPASPSAGDIVAIADYAGTAGCNAIIIGRNGSKFQGTCNCGAVNQEREAVTLVYVDGTQGWQSVSDNTETKVNKQYIQATGGTVSTCGDFKIHTFTSDSAFCVSATGNAAGSNAVDYLVVAGGGSGGHFIGAGGGAGGFRVSNSYSTPAPTMSPLANPTGITVTAQSYPVTVGAGASFHDGPTATYANRKGSNSVFSTITSAGGGGGGFFSQEPGSPVPKGVGGPGGSGGGADYNCAAGGFPNGNPGGTGNDPPVSPPQGNTGGAGFAYPGSGTAAPGGGGGAGAVGGPGPQAGTVGNGGIGSFVASTGFGGCNGTTGPVPNVRYFAGGGGGGGYTGSSGGCGGAGGGGTGATNPNNPPALNGVANTGGGGGGEGGHPSPGPAGGTGGSGIVIIRYKFQN